MKRIILSLACTLLLGITCSAADYAYGILINSNRLVRAEYMGESDGYTQYLAHVQLNALDTIRLIETTTNATWMVDLDTYSVEGFAGSKDLGYLLCTQAGCYDCYIKLLYQADQLYIGNGTEGCSEGEEYDPTPKPDENRVYLSTGITPSESGAYVYPLSGEYEIGSTVQLKAEISVGGWMFDKWSDDNSWDNPRTITLTQDTTITAIFSPGEYGVLVNGNQLFRGTFTERLEGSYIAQFLASVRLQEGDYFQLINLFHSDNATWRPQLEEGGSSGSFSIDETHNAIACNVNGCYDIYMKIHYGQSDDYVYIGGGTDCPEGEPFGPGDATGELVFSLVGTENLFGSAWNTEDTLTNMTRVGDGMYEYLLDSVTLTPEGDYQYKVIANHQWNVKEYPSVQEDDNYHIMVEEAGVYSVLFSLDSIAGCSYTTNYLHAIIDDTTTDTPEEYTFTLNSAWQFIALPTAFGLTMEDIIVDGGEVEWGIYNSEQRASGRTGWLSFAPAEGGLSTAQAYIVRARNGSATLTIHIPEAVRERAATTLPVNYYAATHPQNANWNFLGNPYPFPFNITNALDAQGIESPIAVWNGTGYDLFTPGIDEKTLSPFEAFFIQMPDNGAEAIQFAPEYIDEDYVPPSPGMLSGAFSVASGRKVHFSQGNLQYQASTGTWQFAQNQYEVVGNNNRNISSTYDGWIDLFGWGTGNNPATSTSDNTAYSTYAEWGDNPISNGGNTGGIWRTLTNEEWSYLLHDRANADSLFSVAYVNGTEGVVILPDQWMMPEGANYISANRQGIFYYNGTYSTTKGADPISEVSYTVDTWQIMEAAGAVFLPYGSYRQGTTIQSSYGRYWSAMEKDETTAYTMGFHFTSEAGNFEMTLQDYCNRYLGLSVRLVK